jgi:predicted O-methyltransferase YrrM
MEFGEVWSLVSPIPGFLMAGQEKWLFDAARESGGDILEIGSYMGRSTCCLGLACLGTARRVHAIDPCVDANEKVLPKAWEPQLRENLRRCGLQDTVEVLVGLSKDFASREWPDIGMLFIDGSHLYEDVLFDFKTYGRHVKSGGLIALHDVIVTHPGSFRAWYEVRDSLVKTGTCGSIGFGRKP